MESMKSLQVGTGARQLVGKERDGQRQVLNGWGNADAEAQGGAAAKFHTDLDEEECSIGSGVTADVNPCQDDGRHEEDRQHDAHNGAQVHGGALCLRGQVVLKACGETVRAGQLQGSRQSGAVGVLGSDQVPEMKASRTSGLFNKCWEGGAGEGGITSTTLTRHGSRGFPRSLAAVQVSDKDRKRRSSSDAHATQALLRNSQWVWDGRVWELGSDCLGSNPGSVTYSLCDLGQIIEPLCVSVIIL